MALRTTEATVTFKHPFELEGIDRRLPAGEYRVVTEKEEIQGISFLAHHRVATFLYTPAIATRHGPHEIFQINPLELERASEADARP